MQDGGGTRLYDAIVEASSKVLKDQKNRKAMIVLSDGDASTQPSGSTDPCHEAIMQDRIKVGRQIGVHHEGVSVLEQPIDTLSKMACPSD